jgi:copper chaperone CopZ
MKTGFWILAVAGCLLSVSCRKVDLRTHTINTPGMKNEACAIVIRNSLEATAGVKKDSIETDLEARKVTVTYDGLILNLKNIEFAIADVGFQANEVPANQKAYDALPDVCK